MYGHLTFSDEIDLIKINNREVQSLTATIDTVGYLFCQDSNFIIVLNLSQYLSCITLQAKEIN